MAISIAARRMNIYRQEWLGRKRDALPQASWYDIQVIPDYEQALRMIEKAVKTCRRQKQEMYAFWLVDADPEKAQEAKRALEARQSDLVYADTLPTEDNASWCMAVFISPGSTQYTRHAAFSAARMLESCSSAALLDP